MTDYLSVLELLIRIANLAVAAYLIWTIVPMYWRDRSSSFSKTFQIMVAALLLFFTAEFASTFRLLEQESQRLVDSTFFFVFLLLLLLAIRKIRHGMLAHDHLVKKRIRARLSDVE
ncbi:MAG: hypothetical protein QXN37_02020 [Candidatus Anstonellaceae archaeon]